MARGVQTRCAEAELPRPGAWKGVEDPAIAGAGKSMVQPPPSSHGDLGLIPPAEYEANHYRHSIPPPPSARQFRVSTEPGAEHVTCDRPAQENEGCRCPWSALGVVCAGLTFAGSEARGPGLVVGLASGDLLDPVEAPAWIARPIRALQTTTVRTGGSPDGGDLRHDCSGTVAPLSAISLPASERDASATTLRVRRAESCGRTTGVQHPRTRGRRRRASGRRVTR